METSEVALEKALTLLDLRMGLGALVEDLPEDDDDVAEGVEGWVPLLEEDLKAATAIGESSENEREN